MKREIDRIKRRLLAMAPNERLFRINAGVGWAGKMVHRLPAGIILANPRPLRAAPEGWFDLCGWTSVTITPEMVGTTIAVFVGEEFKRSTRDKPTAEQQKLGACLADMGGIYRVVTEDG